ncbi:MAG: hypothetical protein U1E87_04945 [Alphaproteobacteria bacterium]
MKIGAVRDCGCEDRGASTGLIDNTSIDNFRGVANVSVNTGVASVNIVNQINSQAGAGAVSGPGGTP